MNDKDRELLADVLRSAGSAGEQGFKYLVEYRFYDGLTSVLGFALAIAGAVWLMKRAFAWKPEVDSYGDSPGGIVRGVAIAALSMSIFGFIWGFFGGITYMLAPEGAAIQNMVTAIKH